MPFTHKQTMDLAAVMPQIQRSISSPKLDTLVVHLRSVGALDDIEEQYIKLPQNILNERIRLLFDYVSKRPNEDFMKLVNILSKVNLGHIRSLLDGVIRGMDGTNTLPGPEPSVPIPQAHPPRFVPPAERHHRDPDVAMAAGPDVEAQSARQLDFMLHEAGSVDYVDVKSHDNYREKVNAIHQMRHGQPMYTGFCTPHQGQALMVTNHKFAPNSGLSNMEAYLNDQSLMAETYTQIGFKTFTSTPRLGEGDAVSKPSHTATEIEQANILFAANLKKEDPCCIVNIMSHGTDGGIYGCLKDNVDLEKILRFYDETNCPNMAGKPKIFVIQACQGVKSDPGVLIGYPAGGEGPAQPMDIDEEPTNTAVRVPFCMDMLLIYAAVRGYQSYVFKQGEIQGSLMIHCLAQELMLNACNLEFHHLLLNVNRRVADKDFVDVKDMKPKKQMCHFDSHLRKQLYLLPKYRD